MLHTRTALGAVALTSAFTLIFAGSALADNLQDSIADTGSVQLVAGDATSSGTASIRVIANSSVSDPDSGCNFDTSTEHLTIAIDTPVGVSASPSSLTFNTCGTDKTVTFTASSSAVSGTATARITDNTSGGTFLNQVGIPITVTQPVPTNTAPSVSVTGVTNGTYEIGVEPTAGCSVSDAEEPGATATPIVDTSGLSHGIGDVTVTCSFTDSGGLRDSDSVTYSIVDTGDPTITASVSPSSPDGMNGWYKTAPTVTFTCADTGSGIHTCLAGGSTTNSKTLGEGAAQAVSGTATDWAGNAASTAVSGLSVDLTNPVASFASSIGSVYFGSVPAAPTCASTDDLSGPAGCTVSGYATTVGTHTLTATAQDLAGRTGTATQTYTVLPWTANGFYQPVDMAGVFNTVKGGSTVPVKFELFAGGTELTDTSYVAMSAKKITCSTSAPVDDIELLATGATSMRYDTTSGQYVYNWKTPTGAGTCYTLTMTANDGSTLAANFKLK